MRQAEPVHVGRYVRDLGASLTRMFENALDWEHLPHLHASSFASIRLIQADATGWRAEATLPGDARPLVLDLRLNDEGWVTRTMRRGELLGEIRTAAAATGERSCRVAVDFYMVGIAEAQRAAAGAYYERLYAQLYDEDEAMMIARQEAIDTRAATRGGWRTIELNDGHHPIPRACPHLGLPLEAEPDADGIITCPWHGYRFEVRTGHCVSGQDCGWKALEAS